jgi:4-amino-4-deoxy-L-arabinose transferase-like glycosyltransferase
MSEKIPGTSHRKLRSDSHLKWLLAIVLAALVVRLAPLARGDMKFATGWDAREYIAVAEGLRSGCGYAAVVDHHCGPPSNARSPGYPAFLAAMPSLRSVLIAQAILGALLCLWLGAFVYRRWGAAAGLLAAALLAFDVPSIVYGAMIMTDVPFQILLSAAMLLQLDAVLGERGSGSTRKIFLTATLLGAASLVRPVGVFLPLLAALPFLILAKRGNWRRSLALGSLAFAIPAAVMGAWTVRNWRRTGLAVVSTQLSGVAYYYDAAGVVSHVKNESMAQAQADLARQLGWKGKPDRVPLSWSNRMTSESLKVFVAHPIATALVMARGLALVSMVPDRNELNELIGTNGGGPLGLPPSYDILQRVRRTLHSPLLTAIVSVQLVLIFFVWIGVGRSVVFTWRNRSDAAAFLIPILFAAAMLISAAGPDAHARFRVAAMPALAMLAGIGWLGRSKRSADAANCREDESLPSRVFESMKAGGTTV